MKTLFGASFFAASLLILISGCATSPHQPATISFSAPSNLPANPEMPDPLVMFDGSRVTSRKQWFSERVPELKELFQHYMYGQLPPRPAAIRANHLGEFHDFLGGKATLKLIRLETGPNGAPQIDLLVVLPNNRRGPAPVFLGMDFCGNQAITDDPRVPLAHSWVSSVCKGCTNGVATEASRLATTNNWPANVWPLEEIIARGYGLAVFYSGDVDPDRPDVSEGIYAWLANGDPDQNNPANRGSIIAWAWGFHRCMDYLVTDSDVDAQHIAALGHSRNGKAVLLAAAFDTRIALVIPHQAGCGGTSPSRGKTGESVKVINARFPHWFNAEFKQFADEPERLPFDQNCLIALCAPRPVLLSNADGDQWSNPAGQFEALKSASAVYRFLGEQGLATKEMPPLHKLVDSRLGYFIREGKHSMINEDWDAFMNFADRQWGENK